MIIEPFQPYHVDLLIAQGVQKQQVREVSFVPGKYANLPRVSGAALTGRREDGHILICGGVIPQEPGIGKLWALLSEDSGPHFLEITRATRRFLETQRYRRIEVTTQKGWAPGCRWLKLLGFKPEGPCPGYGPDGETHIRYGLVRCHS